MNLIRLTSVLILASLVAACASSVNDTDFFKEEVAPKKPKVVNKTALVRNWQADVGSNIREGDAVLSPALLGQHLYAASTSGNVDKVNASNGKRIWQTKLKDERITAGVAVGGGLVLLGTDQGIVYALNQSDGEISWQVQLSSEILASPAIDADVVVARTGDGKVVGLAAYDGKELWTISRQLPKLTLRGDSRPLLFGGIAFTGFSDGTLAAVEAKTGRPVWDFPISFPRGTSEIDRLSDIDTNPLLVNDFIYISSYQEVTHALNIKEQRISWSVDVSSFHSLAYDAANLYITDKKGVVHQVERSTGKKNWSQGGLKLSNVGAPVSVGPYVVFGDGDSNLYVVDKKNGGFVGKHGLGAKRIVGEAIVDGDSIYIMDSDGDLQSFAITPKN